MFKRSTKDSVSKSPLRLLDERNNTRIPSKKHRNYKACEHGNIFQNKLKSLTKVMSKNTAKSRLNS